VLIAGTFFPLGFFALVSLASDVEANWPAMYLLAAPALLAPLLLPVRRWVLAAALGNLILVGLYGLHAATAALPLPDNANRVLRETHGFRELADLAAGLDGPVYAARYQDVAMLRFHAPGIAASQWPGLHRPSEYLRGRIAPRVVPGEVTTPFWLLVRGWQIPGIPGFTAATPRRLFDCPGEPLAEAAEPPCERPLHVWSLVRQVPVTPPPGAAPGPSTRDP
jgi:hypothetical protein